MKEGMVLEVYKDYVAVLTRDGEYLKLRKKGEVKLGDIYRAKPYYKIPFIYVAAAIMLIIISSYTGITAYANQIVGYVDITAEKNIRLYVNRRGTVQKAEGVENPKSLKNLTIEGAAKKISKSAEKEGIFSENSDIQVTTKKLKKSDVNLEKEKEKLEKSLSKIQRKDQKEADKGNDSKDNNSNGNNSKGNNSKNNNNKNNDKSNDKNEYKNNNKTDIKYFNKNFNKYNNKKEKVKSSNNSSKNKGQNSSGKGNSKNKGRGNSKGQD